MSSNLMQAATAHRFPRVFHRHPRLLAVVHLLMRLTTLRVWFVRRAFREVLAGLPEPFTLVDAGCGHGDYLFPAARRKPASRFVGVDKIADNIAVCRGYARACTLTNVGFEEARAECYATEGPVDVVSCIGVMQLVEDDERLLDRFRSNLRPGGILLLYEPVFNRRILPFYERLLARLSDPYHVVQHRQHVYEPGELLRKLDAAGFEVFETRYSFGWAGRAYYEGYNLCLYGLLSSPWVFWPVLVPLFVLVLPLFWTLMAADYFGRRRTGNGIVVKARKR